MTRILLSAIYCEPNRGSEQGVAWHFATELIRLGHEVTVLTHDRQRPAIEAHVAAHPDTRFPDFLYIPYPAWMEALDKRFGVPDQITLFVWQLKLKTFVRQQVDLGRFDLIWHVTGAVRQASMLYDMGLPFVFGPVAGGETAPWKLRANFTPFQHAKELFRDSLNLEARIDPYLQPLYRKSTCLLPRSEDTKALFPKEAQSRAYCNIGIGIEHVDEAPSNPNREPGSPIKAFYVGRFLHWKQPLLTIDAFDRFLSSGGTGTLTMLGSGKTEPQCAERIRQLGREQDIQIVKFLPQDEFFALLRSGDVLLFPSLHDGGGMVVLEALALGIPSICFDLGGPGQIVTPESGMIIPSKDLSIDGAVEAIADSLRKLQAHPELRSRLRYGALERAREFTWGNVVERAISQIDEALASQGIDLRVSQGGRLHAPAPEEATRGEAAPAR